MFDENNIPTTWLPIPLGELCKEKVGLRRGPFGSAIKKEFFVPKGYKVYEQGNAIYNDAERGKYFINESKYDELKNFSVQPGDFIVSCSGTLGKIYELPADTKPGIINQALLRIRLIDDIICRKYFLYFFRSGFFQREIIDQSQGTAMSNLIGIKDFKCIKIPIPPLPEQKRIVVKLEELLSEVDKTVSILELVKQQLEVYKHAVLGKAFEGRFSSTWRNLNPNMDANIVFEEVKAHRDDLYTRKIEGWTIDCEEAVANGTPKPTKPKKPYTSKPISEEEKLQFLNMPSSWAFVRFIDLVKYEDDAIKRGPFGSAIKKSFFVPSGFKVYEQQNAIENDPSLGKYYISKEKYLELEGFSVKPGDFIVSCSGTIGRILQLPEDCEPGIINQALMKIRLDENLMHSKYFLYLFRSEVFQRRIINRGTGMQNLASIDDIKDLIILLPPIREQEQIIQEIDSRLSVYENVEETIAHVLLQAEAFRQSILKKAFEGKLVPQDPNDEPASVLLERIIAQREQNKPVKKVREKKPRTKTVKTKVT